MRYLIKFSKESNIKFISHLDLMRTLQKVVKRAALPVEYSYGFNPHMNISIAQPLSVGMYSCGEYMDIVFKETLNTIYIKGKLNENAPSGIKFLEVIKIRNIKENEKKIPQAMATIGAAAYLINIKYNNAIGLNDEIDALGKKEEWNIIKKSKSGEKEVNIKTMIKKFEYKIEENVLTLNVLISAGSRENLSADLLSKFIQNNTSNVLKDAFVDIKREEMYGIKNKKYIPLYKFLGEM
ncbi:TIGR03936 family radical SAM-associated protein [Clostridium rectalis]|uniref:TIGR03936 family radical SAM-associated protein n=1 Tax=Clostridium rectalis TaxID=2040295 RepID=UPI000F6402C9|nr:TIGR03936 family radical SAM-associated protein [Clostridium rectalis]